MEATPVLASFYGLLAEDDLEETAAKRIQDHIEAIMKRARIGNKEQGEWYFWSRTWERARNAKTYEEVEKAVKFGFGANHIHIEPASHSGKAMQKAAIVLLTRRLLEFETGWDYKLLRFPEGGAVPPNVDYRVLGEQMLLASVTRSHVLHPASRPPPPPNDPAALVTPLLRRPMDNSGPTCAPPRPPLPRGVSASNLGRDFSPSPSAEPATRVRSASSPRPPSSLSATAQPFTPSTPSLTFFQ